MAQLTVGMPDDIIEQFRKLSNAVDEVAPQMAKGGAEVLAEEVRRRLEANHKRTGALAKSVTVKKPSKSKGGVWSSRVYFKGSDAYQADDKAMHTTYKRKSKDANAQKAIAAEYGTENQPAEPFLRPAVSEKGEAIANRMRWEFEHGVKK